MRSPPAHGIDLPKACFEGSCPFSDLASWLGFCAEECGQEKGFGSCRLCHEGKEYLGFCTKHAPLSRPLHAPLNTKQRAHQDSRLVGAEMNQSCTPSSRQVAATPQTNITNMCLSLSLYIYVCEHTYTKQCMYIHVHAHVCMYVCMHACMYVCMYVCNVYVYIHICMCVCTYVRMYVCLAVCLHDACIHT